MDQNSNPIHGTVLFRDLKESLELLEAADSKPDEPFLQTAEPVFGQQFDRMFPELPPSGHTKEFLKRFGKKGGPMDEGTADRTIGDSSLPAGNAFLGQYIDHTITLEVQTELPDPAATDDLQNFRTPRLDLDSVYGADPEVDNFLYTTEGSSGETAKLLVGVDEAGNEIDDLQRNQEGTAIIGDPRNDENTIISQMQLAFIRFHNRVVDALVERGEYEGELLERAQELVRRHFQWAVVNQFLPNICESSVLDDVLENGRQYFTPDAPGDVYLPLEFAGAAYRYGHSQIRQAYVVNDESSEQRFYGPPDEALGFGFQPVCPEDTVEWKYFFDLEDGTSPQPARKIDPLIRPVLLDLPFFDGKFTSLATRNLLRGHVLQLPSGQDVAEEIGATQLSNEQIGLKEPIERIYDDIDASPPEEAGAPLWYYVLGEAQHEQDGDKLGPVGSRVVAETLVALLEADPTSYRNRTDWAPTLVASETDTPIGDFRIQDILAEGPLLFESDLDLDRSVVIQGTGGDMGTRYTVEVSDTLAQATGSIGGIPVTDNPDETVTKSRADGRVAGGADGYRFTGDIAGFSLTDHSEATVYVDEEEVDSRQIPGRNPIPRTLIIEGSGEYTEYSFMTSRGLRQVEGLLEGKAVTKDESDTVDGLTASGAVVGGADGFRFGGEIIDFSIDQPDKVTIYVDGQVRDVETLPSKDLPRTLVLESDPSRPDAGYTVSVSGVIKQAEGSVDGIPVSKDPNDTVESPNADGYVAAGADGFRFTGEITEFSLDDPDAATVYVDGKPRDLDHLPAQVTASFDANPPDPAPNEAVTFDGGSSKAPFGEIVTHEWEIRRGELGEGEIVESGIGELLSTRLEEPGTYTVRLFVTGEDGSTASTAHRLQIEPEPDAPTARIEWRNEPVQVGERISFSAAPSTDPDGDIVDRVWMVSHQGESIARATGETFAFEFDTPGDYTVRLQVNDDDARQDTTSIEVTVNP